MSLLRLLGEPEFKPAHGAWDMGWPGPFYRRVFRWRTRSIALALLIGLAGGLAIGHVSAATSRSAPDPTAFLRPFDLSRYGERASDWAPGSCGKLRAHEPVEVLSPVWSTIPAAALERGLDRPSRRPEPSPAAVPPPEAVPSPASGDSQDLRAAAKLSGTATWYCLAGRSPCTRGYPGGLYAAAGPALRAALGDWRGRNVTITASDGNRVSVTLIDWCACPGGRVIDLYGEAFLRLAPLSRGVLRVTVTW